MITDIGTYSMKHLQTDVVFGIAAFFLYVVVPTALLANEVRLAKSSDDTSGTAPILDAMMQAGFFIVIWLSGVTIFMFVLIGLTATTTALGPNVVNPSVGMWDFWAVDWLNSSVMSSLDHSSQIYLTYGDTGLAQAQGLVLILSIAKMVEVLLLFLLLLLTTKLSMALPLYKMRRSSHHQMTSELDISAALTYMMVAMMGIILLSFIIGLSNILLEALFDFATSRVAGVSFGSGKVDILDDVWILMRLAQSSF